MYKAKQDIGGYKVGDKVPADKAKLWNEMYIDSPVEEIVGNAPANKPADDKPKVEEKKETPEDSNAMHDDYLNRNTDVVKKAIKDDKLNKSTLNSLIKLESKDKRRKQIIEALNLKMKSL